MAVGDGSYAGAFNATDDSATSATLALGPIANNAGRVGDVPIVVPPQTNGAYVYAMFRSFGFVVQSRKGTSWPSRP